MAMKHGWHTQTIMNMGKSCRDVSGTILFLPFLHTVLVEAMNATFCNQ
jgi:hypothetical protein